MATISAPDLAKLRTNVHRSSFYLSVFQPVVLLQSLVTGSPTRGQRAVQYNTGTGTAGQFAAIEAYQLVEIVTSTGTESVRLKSITGNQVTGTITIDENDIAAANGDVIRVLHFYPLVAIPPAIRGGVFYKFFDVVYSDGNSKPPPVAIIGPHLVGVLSAGSVAFSLNSSSSYAVAQGATISSRVWSCVHNGGATTDISFSSTTAANPTLTITAADQYWLKCVVTDSNGKTQATWRAIFVFSSLNNAYNDFTVTSLSGDWQTGGWQASISATGNVTLSDFPDGTLAVIHYKNYFNSTEGYVDLWGAAGQNIVMAGYIRRDQDNDNFDNGTGAISFDITTPDGVMDNMSELGSISLNAVAAPGKWYQYASWMTCGRGVHHLLKWHTSVLETCDVLGLTDNTLGVLNIDFTEPSVLQMINSLGYQRGIFAKMVSSRLGRLYFSADSQMLNTAARAALDTVFILDTPDISGVVDVVRQPEANVATSDLDGFSFNGTTSTPFISIIPGYRESAVSYGLPGYRGVGATSTKSQVLNDQTDSNEKCGRVQAAANNNPLEMRFTTPANYLGAFDIVPSIGWYNWGLADNDLKRSTDLNGRLLICRNVTHQISHEAGTVQTSFVGEPEAFGPDGIQGNYPVGYPAPALRAPTWSQPLSSIILTFADADDSDNGKAVIAVTGSITVGAIATFAAGTTAWTSVCALSATKAVVCWENGSDSNQGYACVLSVSGTTITAGTPAIFETGATTEIDVCALSSSQALVCYRDGGNSNQGTACILDVSGTTVTPATPVVFETGATQYIGVARLTAAKAIVCYRDDGNGGAGTASVLDVTGSVITANVPAVFYNADVVFRLAVDALGSDSVVVVFGVGTGTSLAGFVLYNITTGFTSGGGYTVDLQPVFDSAEPGNHWLRTIGSTGAVLAYQTGSGAVNPFNIYGTALNINSTVITAGTPVRLSANANDEVASVALASSTKALVFYGQQAIDGDAVTVTLAGTTVTDNGDTTIVTSNYARYTSSATLQ